MKRNVRFLCEFDGSRYLGWEHQPGTDMTIQGKIENIYEKLLSKKVEVIGAGRTDAGVHAKGFVCNAIIDTDLNETQIRDYFNRYLPDDICIKEVIFANDRFHSRYNATGKTYKYTCFCGRVKTVFDRKYVYSLDFVPDISKMNEAAQYLIGEHDFASFCANSKMKKSTVRHIYSIDIKKEGDYITFIYHGNGFLQHMVRILTGTLLSVGKGELEPERVRTICGARDRALAGPTAPPEGLCLLKVDYEQPETCKIMENTL